MWEGFKKIDSGVYKKWPNFWIHNTDFKPDRNKYNC